MKARTEWAPGAGIRVLAAERQDAGWVVSAVLLGSGRCPMCDLESTSRFGWYVRRLQDLPNQGSTVELRLKLARWRCRNLRCERQTFINHLPKIAPPFARRTHRVIELALLFAHATGGRPAERLMRRLGVPQSDDTLLRSLKRHVADHRGAASVRALGIDDWSWRKGSSYGTIMVDLERREVLDVLADRSADGTAEWLALHPELEVVSRDRCGLYAQGAVRGAPQARQIADRFHVIQNLRHAIEQQLSRAPCPDEAFVPGEAEPEVQHVPTGLIHRYGSPAVTEHRRRVRAGHRAGWQDRFDRVKALQAEGKTLDAIVRETGSNWRTVAKWTRLDVLPERRTMAAKLTTPGYFRAYLARRWAEGCTLGRELLAEIRPLGYAGSLTHLQRLLKAWRQAHFVAAAGSPMPRTAPEDAVTPTVPPIIAAALCIKPRGQLTEEQGKKVDMLKASSAEFAAMRHLVMRFRGILRGHSADKLDAWLRDAQASGIHCIRQFVFKLRQDFAAIRNAISELWSNGQTEGQINRLKTLKRAMYGRAGVELLRARMLPLQPTRSNTD